VVAKIGPRLSLRYSDYRNQLLLKKLKSCGQDCHFHGSIIIAWPERLFIGNKVHINHNAYINAAGGVVIGNNTHISRNLTLYSYSHNYGGEALPYDDTNIKKNR
jgi:maltose O-acetyltransferase